MKKLEDLKNDNWLTRFAAAHGPEAVLLKAVRALSVVAIAEAAIILFCIGLIQTLFPLQKIQPYLMQVVDRSDVVVKVEPIDLAGRRSDFQIRNLLTTYVRHTEEVIPDIVVMESRFFADNVYLAYHSSEEILNRLREEKRVLLNSALRTRRRVNVLSIKRHTQFAEVYRVNYETLDIERDREKEPAYGDPDTLVRRWIAEITLAAAGAKTTYAERVWNPYGLIVVRYASYEDRLRETPAP